MSAQTGPYCPRLPQVHSHGAQALITHVCDCGGDERFRRTRTCMTERVGSDRSALSRAQVAFQTSGSIFHKPVSLDEAYQGCPQTYMRRFKPISLRRFPDWCVNSTTFASIPRSLSVAAHPTSYRARSAQGRQHVLGARLDVDLLLRYLSQSWFEVSGFERCV